MSGLFDKIKTIFAKVKVKATAAFKATAKITAKVTANDNEQEPTDVICDKLGFTGSEAYKLLRANLMFALPREGDRCVIGVTSAIRGEGKSTTAINLAYTLAQTGSNVLLIDADLRLPSVSKRLNIGSKMGLSNYLAGLCDISDAIETSEKLQNLYVMPAGAIPPNPSELLASEKMKNMLSASSKVMKYTKYIIIDLPPVNIVSDALAISQLTDGMLITVRQNQSDKKSLDACINQLNLVNAKIAGFVFNDASEEGTHYGKYKKYSKYYKKHGYGYRGYYGKNHGYGYGYGYGYEKEV